jgi:vitamin K-dependent gamma-carboxylase
MHCISAATPRELAVEHLIPAPLATEVATDSSNSQSEFSIRRTLSRVWDSLFEPVDPASLTVFRVALGLAVAGYALKTLLTPVLQADFIRPQIHLTYYGFEWVRPWPGQWMVLHFVVMLLASLGTALGWCYRLSALLMLLTFTHTFLIERTLYNNHYYLIILLSILANVVPLQRHWSLDSIRPLSKAVPELRVWMLWLLRFQVGVVYFFGGIAKLDADWLRGQPMGMWLAAKSDLPVVGPWLANPAIVPVFTIGGLLIDLLAVPLLLWRPTRRWMFVVLLAFHMVNSQLFSIGLFPWLMMIATLLLFPADWPRKLLRRPPFSPPAGTSVTGTSRLQRRVIGGFLCVYAAIQGLVPLRHYLYAGNPSWTENGQLFAWRMMLRQKLTGFRFYGTDPATGQKGVIDVTSFLNQRQAVQMSRDPDLIVHFSHLVSDYLKEQGHAGIEIRAKVLASLNGRKPQLLIDPTVDLAQEPRCLGSQPWIVPLREPFRETPWNEPMEQWERLIEGPSQGGTSR